MARHSKESCPSIGWEIGIQTFILAVDPAVAGKPALAPLARVWEPLEISPPNWVGLQILSSPVTGFQLVPTAGLTQGLGRKHSCLHLPQWPAVLRSREAAGDTPVCEPSNRLLIEDLTMDPEADPCLSTTLLNKVLEAVPSTQGPDQISAHRSTE